MLSRGREAAGRQLAGHRADVLAVCLFVAGAIVALGLWTDLAGPVGTGLADGAGAAVGRARVAIPLACFAFGVVLLWPFSPRRVELESVFIIDLVVWGLMAGAMLTARFLKSEDGKRRTYQAAVAALGAYVILCLAAHSRAEAQVRETLARENLHPQALRVFPEPLGPHRFRAAARVGDAWNVYLCSLWGGRSELRGVFPSDDAAPRVAEIRATPKGRALDRFMAAPVWTLQPDGRVQVYDLRFRSIVVPRSPTFQVEFPPGSLDPVVR